jgi:hypothetical protein
MLSHWFRQLLLLRLDGDGQARALRLGRFPAAFAGALRSASGASHGCFYAMEERPEFFL